MRLSITMIVFAFSLVCGSSLFAQEDQSDEIKKLKAENSRLSSLLKQRQQNDANSLEASQANTWEGQIEIPSDASADRMRQVWMKYHALPRPYADYPTAKLVEQYHKAMEQKPSEFWIGVQCTPAPEMELKVGEDGIPLTISEGVLVNSVVEGSPAESAGILEGDVLLQFNGKKLLELQMLVQAISDTGETEAKVHLVRDGELTVVNVKPTQRKDEKPKLAESGVDFSQLFFMSDAIPEGYEVDIRLRKGESPTLAFLKEGIEEVSVNLETIDQLPRELSKFGGKAMEAVKNLDQESNKFSVEDVNIDASRALKDVKLSPFFSRFTNLDEFDFTPIEDNKLEKIEKALEELRNEVRELKNEK